MTHDEYIAVRSESRQGVRISQEEADRINSLIYPLVLKGQSQHSICLNHMDEIMRNERTLYHYINDGILDVRNIDLPRKVRFSKRKIKNGYFKVDRKCRLGRTYEDFLCFMQLHPDTPVIQMNSVEGRKGGKVLLTFHLTNLKNTVPARTIISLLWKILISLIT